MCFSLSAGACARLAQAWIVGQHWPVWPASIVFPLILPLTCRPQVALRSIPRRAALQHGGGEWRILRQAPVRRQAATPGLATAVLPLTLMISGATYWGVPQMVVIAAAPMYRRASPKSAGGGAKRQRPLGELEHNAAKSPRAQCTLHRREATPCSTAATGVLAARRTSNLDVARVPLVHQQQVLQLQVAVHDAAAKNGDGEAGSTAFSGRKH